MNIGYPVVGYVFYPTRCVFSVPKYLYNLRYFVMKLNIQNHNGKVRPGPVQQNVCHSPYAVFSKYIPDRPNFPSLSS